MGTKLTKYLLLWLLILLAVGCTTTRFVPDGQYLVKDDARFIGNVALSNDQLAQVTQVKANRKVLGGKLYLYAYNLGKRIEKDSMRNGLRPWLVRQLTYQIGEPPRLLDTVRVIQGGLNLRRTYFSEGFFYPTITDSIEIAPPPLKQAAAGDTTAPADSRPKRKSRKEQKQKKATVYYLIEEGPAYQYRKVTYDFPTQTDSLLYAYYDIAHSLLQPGDNYSHEKMKQERNRATEALRNAGYFTFSPNQITFEIDTQHLALDTMGLVQGGREADSLRSPRHTTARESAPLVKLIDLKVQIKEEVPRYFVNQVQIIVLPPGGKSAVIPENQVRLPAYEIPRALRDSLGLKERQIQDGLPMSFVADRDQLERINFNFLAGRVLLKQGQRYSRDNNRQTQQRLQELGMFRYVLVNVKPRDSLDQLDIRIEMQLAKKYQVRLGTEGFTNDLTTSNLPGIGTNLVFRDRNTFHKSEFLELGLVANMGLYVPLDPEKNRAPFFEFGANTKLNFNRFLLPFPSTADFSQFSPYTTLAASFNQDRRNEYDRLILRGKLSYRWNHIPFSDEKVSRFTPFFIDLIDVRRLDSTFAETINTLPLIFQRDYQRRFGSRLQYSFTRQNYGKTRAFPTYWFRASIESGGTLPFLLDLTRIGTDNTPDEGINDNLLFGKIYYGQYLKSSVETKFLLPVNAESEVVLRGLIGGSFTYNNTPSVPYESRFFSGGTNSMRGWLSNTLGPGTSTLTDFLVGNEGTEVNYSLIAPGGEWVLELNAEYRFDVWTYLEMALFTDVGNVWFHDSPRIREQLGKSSIINIDNMRLGWDVGIGFRFDFSFLIFRVDLAQQLFAPDLGRGWVIGNPKASESVNRRNQVQIGINYPF